MGASTSKSQTEPVIFYNPNVPLQFSSSLVNTLEKKAEQTSERIHARQVESLVNQRVAQELEKLKQQEAELKDTLQLELVEKNKEKVHLSSVNVNADVESMIERISRSSGKELPKEIKEYQDKVIACYNKNKDRSLDCWKEVSDFKQAVGEEQKKFVASYQK